MTQDEKVALLKEAGVWDVIGFPGCIDKLIALVAAHERAACAKVCEQIDTAAFGSERPAPNDCAAAIRARGNNHG